MNAVGISENDEILVREQPEVENGQLAVVMVNGDEATVKRFYKEKGTFRLQPENPDFEPIISDEITILGKVIAVIRYY